MDTTWGDNLKITLFGQSHSRAIGVVVDGLPAGLPVDAEALQAFLARRAPGGQPWSTPRREADAVEILSGIHNGRTCGAPFAALIRNGDCRSADYALFARQPRPGHADHPAQVKYRGFNDPRGGGAFSGRMTAPLCIAGGLCLQFLAARGIGVWSRIASVGGVTDPAPLDGSTAAKPFPVVDDAAGRAMQEAIASARDAGDSLGGVVEAAVAGLPAGLGGPLFGGIESRLAQVVFAIPAVKGFEIGEGFAVARLRGSENNDAFAAGPDGSPVPATNHAGGLLGGITTGAPLRFRVAFKPTPSIARGQLTLDTETGRPAVLNVPGRHDPCIVPRAVPVVEAAAALVIFDALLERGKDPA